MILYVGGLCMETNEIDVLERQQLRRQRINRIKTGIIMSIFIWMLVSFLAVIILSVQVIKLNSHVSDLFEMSAETGGGNQSTNGSDGKSRFDKVVTGIDTEDNFAKEGDAHYVYLTFNSVPGDNTNEILDVLEQHKVKATFFVVGNDDDGASDVYRRIVEDGHTIGMHSYSNQYSSIYSSIAAFQKDYKKISEYIYDITGKKSKYYRFPGGSGNAISNVDMAEFVNILNQEKITYFDWNVSAGDAANNYSKQDILDNVLDGVSKYKTSVVLMHDDKNKSTTVEALGPLIDSLKKQGAEILPIDENTDLIQYIKAESVK